MEEERAEKCFPMVLSLKLAFPADTKLQQTWNSSHISSIRIILMDRIAFLRIQLKLNTALLSTVRPCVTGLTSHISHIYKGINAMLIIRVPIEPYIF